MLTERPSWWIFLELIAMITMCTMCTAYFPVALPGRILLLWATSGVTLFLLYHIESKIILGDLDESFTHGGRLPVRVFRVAVMSTMFTAALPFLWMLDFLDLVPTPLQKAKSR